jgi:hypothetical protein
MIVLLVVLECEFLGLKFYGWGKVVLPRERLVLVSFGAEGGREIFFTDNFQVFGEILPLAGW